jgi:hypothetical protein
MRLMRFFSRTSQALASAERFKWESAAQVPCDNENDVLTQGVKKNGSRGVKPSERGDSLHSEAGSSKGFESD